MAAPDRQCTPPQGFSLIEVIVALLLLGILGVVGSSMIGGSAFTNQVISNEQQAYSRARYAIERLSREIREMKYDASSVSMVIASPPGTNMTSSQLAFTKAGMSTDTPVNIVYTPPKDNQLGSIALAYDGGSYELVNNLTNSVNNSDGIFSYYKANEPTIGNEATDGTDVYYVRIDLEIKPDSTKDQTLKLTNLIRLRNR